MRFLEQSWAPLPICFVLSLALLGLFWFFLMFSFFLLNFFDEEMMVSLPGSYKSGCRVQVDPQGPKAKAGRVCNWVRPLLGLPPFPPRSLACCQGVRAGASGALCQKAATAAEAGADACGAQRTPALRMTLAAFPQVFLFASALSCDSKRGARSLRMPCLAPSQAR